MQFMTEDIDNFAKSVIIDETLQMALEEEEQLSEFEPVSYTHLDVYKRQDLYSV